MVPTTNDQSIIEGKDTIMGFLYIFNACNKILLEPRCLERFTESTEGGLRVGYINQSNLARPGVGSPL